MARLLLHILFVLFVNVASAQLVADWSVSIGGTGNDRTYSHDADENGNIFMTGYFNDNIQVGDRILESKGKSDVFVSKMSPNGELEWVKGFGGTGLDIGNDIITADGNVYITGQFQDSLFINDRFGYLVSGGKSDLFIIKMSTQGEVLWVESFSSIYRIVGTSLAIDNSGNIIIGALTQGEVTCGSSNDTISQPANNQKAAALICLNEKRGFLWITSFESTGNVEIRNIELDPEDNIICTGFFTNSLSCESYTFTSNGKKDIFLAKTSSTGDLEWINSYGGTEDDISLGLTSSINDNIYITGSYNSTITFGQTTLESQGSHDVFVTKIDEDNNIEWAVGIGSNGKDMGRSITVDQNDNVYVTGFISEATTITTTTGIVSFASLDREDVFISQINDQGNINWVSQLGGIGFDIARDIIFANEDELIVSGFFTNEQDADPLSSVSRNIASNGDKDGFVSKLHIAELTLLTVEEVSANSFDEPFTFETIEGATSYELQLINTSGKTFTHQTNTSSNTTSLIEMGITELAESFEVRVRAYKDGAWGYFGEISTVNSPTSVPTTSLEEIYCGINLASVTDPFFANEIAGAQNYEYQITDNTTGNVTIIQTNSASSMMRLSVPGLSGLNKSYSIQVRASIDNVWGALGDACEINSPTEMSPTGSTKLRNSSCGTTLSSFDERIRAKNVSGGLAYVFEILNTETNQIVEILRFRRWFTLSEIGYTDYDVVYEIRVKAWSWETGDVGDFGDVCTIQAPLSSPKYGASSLEENIASSTPVVYPNPSSGEYVYIALSSELTQEVDILIIDAMGSISNTSTTTLNEGENAVYIDFKNTLQPGIYYIRILDKTVRFIVQ